MVGGRTGGGRGCRGRVLVVSPAAGAACRRRSAGRSPRCGRSRSALVVLFLCRPVILLPPVADRDLVVPVLVDVSRSMRIADADGATRLARAAGIFEQDIAPSLAGAFTTEVYAVGDSWTAAQPADLPIGREAKQPGRSRRRDPRTLSRAPGAWHRADFRRRDHRERRGSRRRRAAVHHRRRVGARTERPRGRGAVGRRSSHRSDVDRPACVDTSAAATAVHRFSCASWPTAACSSRET